MKKGLVFVFALIALNCLSFEFPKKFLGHYEAEVKAFDFEHNENDLSASSYFIKIILKEDAVWYQSGKMKFSGKYKDVKSEGPNWLFDINVSNERSVNFDFNLDINKKTGVILLKGLKGVPETRMYKTDVKQKNTGWGRL